MKRQRQTLAAGPLPEDDESEDFISKEQLLDMQADMNKPNPLLNMMENKENVNRNLISEIETLKQQLSAVEDSHASQVQDLETQLQHAQDEVLNLKIELDDANQTLHLGREFQLMQLLLSCQQN